jgi:trehalose 6-phosphate phosphatase
VKTAESSRLEFPIPHDPMNSSLPPALERRAEIAARIDHNPVAAFLDYDGTLAPIAPRPELAALPEQAREVVARLARLCPTAIVSGRGREDVARRVGLASVWTIGSHGFEIAGPEGSGILYEPAPETAPAIAEAARKLREAARSVPGSFIEEKKFSISAHYRLAEARDVPELDRIVDEIAGAHPELRRASGKKLFELRPRLDWNKGSAIVWVLRRLDPAGDLLPIVLGDDATDEDSFAATGDRGITILVGTTPHPTAAAYSLRDPEQARLWLEWLADELEKREIDAPAP